jgi:hypothetical protein
MSQKKQHGKASNSSILAIRISNYRSEGTCDCSLSLYDVFSFKISGQDFVLWGRTVTPHVSNPQGYGNRMFKRP